MRLLLPYLFAARPAVDRHVFYLNTDDAAGEAFIRDAATRHPDFITLVPGVLPYRWWSSIYPMYNLCREPGTVYIKVDDDICYVEPGSFERLARFRIEHPEYFLVYPAVVNNNMDLALGLPTITPFFWANAPYALEKHHAFARNYPRHLENYYGFSQRELEPARVAINCVSWLGEDMAACGPVPEGDEEFLSDFYPKSVGRKNAVVGTALVSHFSFNWQRAIMRDSGFYDYYKRLLPGGDW